MRATFVFDADGVLQAVIDDQRDMNAHPQGALEAVKAIVG
jgi:peroxiredoxin